MSGGKTGYLYDYFLKVFPGRHKRILVYLHVISFIIVRLSRPQRQSMPELPVAWFISFSSGMACCKPCREARISTVTGIMNSKKWSDEVTELVGEAALEVLLSDQAVTTASIICALRERMRTERNRKGLSPARPPSIPLPLTRMRPAGCGLMTLPVPVRNGTPLYVPANTATEADWRGCLTGQSSPSQVFTHAIRSARVKPGGWVDRN
jgi:hypothetical protein